MELLAVGDLGAVLAEGDGLVDLGDIGTGDVVDAAVRNDQVRAGGGGVHLPGGGLCVVGAALIDPVEEDSGRHGAGDVYAVQDQRHHCVRVLLRSLPQVHGDLPRGEGAADGVGAGFGDVHHGVGVCLGLAVGVAGGAGAIGEVLALQVEDDVVCDVHGVSLVGGRRRAVHGDAAVGEGDDRGALRRLRPRLRRGHGGKGGGIRIRGLVSGALLCRAGREQQDRGGQEKRSQSFHKGTSFLVGFCCQHTPDS